MDSLNTIPNSGSFGDVSSKLNDNFGKVQQSLTTLENSRFDSAYSVYVETTTDNPVKTKEEWADSLRVEVLVDKDQFAKNTSTSFPPGLFQDNVPAVSAGEYLWVRRYTSYTDGTVIYSVPRVSMGDVSALGAKLDKDTFTGTASELIVADRLNSVEVASRRRFIAREGSHPTMPSRKMYVNPNYSNSGYLMRGTGVLTASDYYLTTDLIEIGVIGMFSHPAIQSQTAAAVSFFNGSTFISSDVYRSTSTVVPETATHFRLSRPKYEDFTDRVIAHDRVYTITGLVFTTGSYINRSNGTLSSNALYSYSNTYPLNDYKAIALSRSHGSITAADIVFYNASGNFVSANEAGNPYLTVPATATQYKICITGVPDDLVVYGFKHSDSLILPSRSFVYNTNGYWIDMALGKIVRKNNLIHKTEKVSLVSANSSTPKTVSSVETYIMDLEVSFSVKLNSTSANIYVGKGYNFAKLTPTAAEFYKINATLDGSELIENVPFSIQGTGEKITMSFEQTQNDVTYRITGKYGTIEKKYTRAVDERAALMWGVPFGKIDTGEVIADFYVSSKKKPSAKILVAGDSFIAGSSMIPYGIENRWVSLYTDLIGAENVVVSGKGGLQVDLNSVLMHAYESSLFDVQYVFIAMGANNTLNTTTLNGYLTNMVTLIKRIKEQGKTPVLQTIPPYAARDYTTLIKPINDFVKASGEYYVDLNKALTVTGSPQTWVSEYVQSDGVHPSTAGHLAIFKQLRIDTPFLLQI